MLSPSRGFCCCLPVRLGALLVCILACSGSVILAVVTLQSLAKLSAHITTLQTVAYYITSVSWASLAFFSLLGLIAVILQHRLLLTIFTRFALYHIPASFLCNLFMTITLFHFYHLADSTLQSTQCTQTPAPEQVDMSFCVASATLKTMAWFYLFVLVPAVIAQSYAYVIVRRFTSVVSGEWEEGRKYALIPPKTPHYQKRRTIPGPGSSATPGERRETMMFEPSTPEPPEPEEERASFLPRIQVQQATPLLLRPLGTSSPKLTTSSRTLGLGSSTYSSSQTSLLPHPPPPPPPPPAPLVSILKPKATQRTVKFANPGNVPSPRTAEFLNQEPLLLRTPQQAQARAPPPQQVQPQASTSQQQRVQAKRRSRESEVSMYSDANLLSEPGRY